MNTSQTEGRQAGDLTKERIRARLFRVYSYLLSLPSKDNSDREEAETQTLPLADDKVTEPPEIQGYP